VLTIKSADPRAKHLQRSGRGRPARPVAIPDENVDRAVEAAVKAVIGGE
jgi:hypothetical protein